MRKQIQKGKMWVVIVDPKGKNYEKIAIKLIILI